MEKIIAQDQPKARRFDYQNVTKGNLILAPFSIDEIDNIYYRAKVLNISNTANLSEKRAQVYFIDFGIVLNCIILF